MNRRGFLATMLAAGAAPAIVRASSLMKLVVPSTEEVIAINGFTSGLGIIPNTFPLSIQMISAEMLRILKSNLESNLLLTSRVNRSYASQSYKIGDTITIRKPQRYS